MHGRIWFEGNPWPEGHGIKAAEFFLSLSHGYDEDWTPHPQLDLGLTIESEDYYAAMTKEERDAAYDREAKAIDEGVELSDWAAFIAWQNFHRCRFQSSNAVIAKAGSLFDMNSLSKTCFVFEEGLKKVGDWDYESSAFTAYILGHDSLADHKIHISNVEGAPNLYDINWTGAVAMSYRGDDSFDYRFRAQIRNLPFSGIRVYRDTQNDGGESAIRASAQHLLTFKQDDYRFVAEKHYNWLVPKSH